MVQVGWIDKLDRKFGKYGIKNLMLYITALNLVVFIMSFFDRTLISKLMLIPSLVKAGEVWRLITFLFIPVDTSPVWFLFTLYFYYMIGSTLENEWGSFKFTLYYLIGVLGTIAAAFIGGIGSGMFLNLSLIFAFAYLFPNFQLMIFFYIPIKIKYLAIFYVVYLIVTFGSVPLLGLITIGGSVLNFVLFFAGDIIFRLTMGRRVHDNRKHFKQQIPKWVVLHKCTVCGKTEIEDKNMEFRYCVDCDGDHEYCMDHLYTHEHIKNDPARFSEQ